MRTLGEKEDRTTLKNSVKCLMSGEMLKAVVDIERNILAVDAELHSDLEQMLLQNGSAQNDLWGINLYLDEEGEDFIEFDSLINIRPSQGNRSRNVESLDAQAKIREVVNNWVQ